MPRRPFRWPLILALAVALPWQGLLHSPAGAQDSLIDLRIGFGYEIVPGTTRLGAPLGRTEPRPEALKKRLPVPDACFEAPGISIPDFPVPVDDDEILLAAAFLLAQGAYEMRVTCGGVEHQVDTVVEILREGGVWQVLTNPSQAYVNRTLNTVVKAAMDRSPGNIQQAALTDDPLFQHGGAALVGQGKVFARMSVFVAAKKMTFYTAFQVETDEEKRALTSLAQANGFKVLNFGAGAADQVVVELREVTGETLFRDLREGMLDTMDLGIAVLDFEIETLEDELNEINNQLEIIERLKGMLPMAQNAASGQAPAQNTETPGQTLDSSGLY